MYVLERIAADSDMRIASAPTAEPLEILLGRILRQRERSSRDPEIREHLRAAQYRHRFATPLTEFITLSEEHFRIRLDESLPPSPAPSKIMLRRIARTLSAPKQSMTSSSSVSVAVDKALAESSTSTGWLPYEDHEDGESDSERFEI